MKPDEVGTKTHRDAPAQAGEKESRTRTARSNRRIAWTLLALSIIFFAGIIFSRLTGDSRVGLMVLGVAVTLFLIIAIGRNLRK